MKTGKLTNLNIGNNALQEPEIEIEINPAKKTFDLSLFEVFDAGNQCKGGARKDRWVWVNTKGRLTFTDNFSREFTFGEEVKIYLNPKGNIMLIRKEEGGIKLRRDGKKGVRKCCNIVAITHALEEKNVKLPAKYVIEGWDEELKAWIGKKEEKNNA